MLTKMNSPSSKSATHISPLRHRRCQRHQWCCSLKWFGCHHVTWKNPVFYSTAEECSPHTFSNKDLSLCPSACNYQYVSAKGSIWSRNKLFNKLTENRLETTWQLACNQCFHLNWPRHCSLQYMRTLSLITSTYISQWVPKQSIRSSCGGSLEQWAAHVQYILPTHFDPAACSALSAGICYSNQQMLSIWIFSIRFCALLLKGTVGEINCANEPMRCIHHHVLLLVLISYLFLWMIDTNHKGNTTWKSSGSRLDEHMFIL